MADTSAGGKELVLKMDGEEDTTVAGKIWRESSYDFWNEKEKHKLVPENESDNYVFDFPQSNAATSAEDPPSKLIGQFLHKQQASGEFCLDMDLEMAELQNDTAAVHRNLAPITESPVKASRVSFDTNEFNETVRRKHPSRDSPGKKSTESAGANVRSPENGGAYGRSPENGRGNDAEILKCSSRNDLTFSNSSSFKRKSNLFKERTKSRLMDVPPEPPEKSDRQAGRSGQLRSGFLGKTSVFDDEEDDPFDDDLPEQYRKDKLDFWVLLEWVSLILIIGALVSSLVCPFLRYRRLWNLSLWKWGVLVLVLICGRLVSGWVIRIIVFFIERNFLLRKRVLYFVYGVKKAVQNCVWLGLVLMAWHFLFDKKVERETKSKTLRYVTKVLICLVVGTFIWLVKTLVVKVLASSFHVSTYFDRIQESLFNQYVIETLSGPPLIEIKRNEEEEERMAADIQKLQNAGAVVPPGLKAACPSPQSARVVGSGRMQKSPRIGTPKFSHGLDEGDEGITIDHLHKLNPKNVSAWNMKRLINIVRYGALSTLDEQIRDSSHDDDESATKIRSEIEAKAAARKIFHNVAKPGSRFIYLEDLMRFMQEDEALKAMSLFEGASESKKISKSILKNWVVRKIDSETPVVLHSFSNDTVYRVHVKYF